MSSILSGLQSMLTTRFIFKQCAIQVRHRQGSRAGCDGHEDTTPPVLSVTHGSGDTFNIISNEAVWNNAPYVAARYLTASGLKYIHTPASLTGTEYLDCPGT